LRWVTTALVFPLDGGISAKGNPVPVTASCTSGLACSLLRFIVEWKEIVPLVGAVLVAATGALVAFFVTWRLNTAMKQTEFFLRFTERFHNILQAKHQLELKSEESLKAGKLDLVIVKKETGELYRQLFGLMFDEFFAYRKGFLDRDAFAEWMRWRHFDHAVTSSEPNFAIGKTSYKDGWTTYCKVHSAHPEFKVFLDGIHAAKDQAEVSRLVLDHATRAHRLSARIGKLTRDWKVVIVFFAALAISLWVASLVT
jgi:hypothetical protein